MLICGDQENAASSLVSGMSWQQIYRAGSALKLKHALKATLVAITLLHVSLYATFEYNGIYEERVNIEMLQLQ